MNRLLRGCPCVVAGVLLCLAALSAPLLGQALAKALTPADAATYRAAAAALDRGETTAAVSQLEALARRYPRSFPVAETLGLGYARQHRWPAALRWLELAAQLRPDLAVARNNVGITWMQSGNPGRALEQFRIAAQAFPDDFDSQYNEGQALAQSGHLKAAIVPLRRAWQLQPSQPQVGYNLALALYDSGNIQEAGRVLTQLPNAAQIADVQSLWGDVEEKLGHYQAAGGHFQQAATLDPSEPHVFRLGMEFLQHWTLEAAIAVLSQGHKDFPQSLRISTGLALAQYGKGDYGPALALTGQLLEQAPADRSLLNFFGTACTTSAADSPACATLVTFARQHPGNGEAAAYAAGVLLHQAAANGDSPAALTEPKALLQQALRLAPGSAATQFQAGVLALIEHHWPEAVAHLERARQLHPDDEDVHFKLAQAYQHNGQTQQAKQELQRHQELIHRQQSDFDRRYQAIQSFIVQVGQSGPKRSGKGKESTSP